MASVENSEDSTGSQDVNSSAASPEMRRELLSRALDAQGWDGPVTLPPTKELSAEVDVPHSSESASDPKFKPYLGWG